MVIFMRKLIPLCPEVTHFFLLCVRNSDNECEFAGWGQSRERPSAIIGDYRDWKLFDDFDDCCLICSHYFAKKEMLSKQQQMTCSNMLHQQNFKPNRMAKTHPFTPCISISCRTTFSNNNATNHLLCHVINLSQCYEGFLAHSPSTALLRSDH